MLPLFLILLGQFLSLAQKVTESTHRYYQACKRGAEIRHRRKLLGRYSRSRRRAHRNMLLSLGVSSGVLLQIQAARNRRRCWVYPRTTAWWEQFALREWSDEKWLEHFRMTRGTFQYLADELRPVLQRQHTAMRVPISVEKRLAIALWWLATNCCSRTLSEQFGIGRSSASQISIEVCLAIESHLFQRLVRFGDLEETMAGFGQLGFPRCVGAVGGTHIGVLVPCRQATDSVNQKNYFSVLLQATVDARGQIWNAEVSYSGENDDSFDFRQTGLCAAMESGTLFPVAPPMKIRGVQVPPLLVGDGAYPLEKWLLTPYGGHLNAVRTHFNACLTRARTAVERCFGRMKKRWRALRHTLHVDEANINSVIIACVVLHNICEAKDGPLPLWDAEIPAAGNSSANGGSNRTGEEAKRVRDALALFLWENRERN